VGIVADCTNTFGRAIFRGATRYANLQRRWLLFKDLGRLFERQHRLSALDGGIFAGMSKPVFEYALRQCRYGVFCSGGGDPAVSPVVALDDVAAGAQAAQHLMDCRLERFAFYGYNADYRTSGNRLAGFRDALAARGFTCDVCPLEPPTDVQRSSHTHRPALTAWLQDLPKPIGIMAWDDTHATEVAEACLEAGIGVPDQVAIIGVNNDDLLCESAWPPLSSVEADFTRVGYAAARVLDRLLNGEELAQGERLTLISPLGVVRRQSTSTLAIRDPNLAAAVLFIRDHACDPCSVADVLQRVPVGRRWLERQFAEKLGRTPHDEIARVRVEAAQRLLLRSDLDVPEIAVRCGFVEPKNFHVAFRKLTGTTPAAYRRQGSSPAGSLRDT
jgi:LacI family transcriptional regulator